jgi:hypothetical protein
MHIFNPLAKMLVIMLSIFSMPLTAQLPDPVRGISYGYSGGSGSPKRSVYIKPDGMVEISGEKCENCRWHAPYNQQFDLPAEDFQKIAQLFNVEALEQAARAPCTMEAAGRSSMRENIIVFLESGSRSFKFIMECASPELKIVRDQIAIANSILEKAAPNLPE